MHKLLEEIQNKARSLVTKAIESGVTFATAESCTGGLLSGAITSVPGSSKVFQYGFIVYANEAKIKILKVPNKLLLKYGAVSPQVAESMSINTANISKASMSISITGIAGPNSDNTNKPVGLVYISVTYLNITYINEYHFTGDRNSIRLQTVAAALTKVLDILQK